MAVLDFSTFSIFVVLHFFDGPGCSLSLEFKVIDLLVIVGVVVTVAVVVVEVLPVVVEVVVVVVEAVLPVVGEVGVMVLVEAILPVVRKGLVVVEEVVVVAVAVLPVFSSSYGVSITRYCADVIVHNCESGGNYSRNLYIGWGIRWF